MSDTQVDAKPPDAQGSASASPIPSPPPLVRQYCCESTAMDIPSEVPRMVEPVTSTTDILRDLPPGDYIVRVSLSELHIQRLWADPVQIQRFDLLSEVSAPKHT